MRIAAALLVAMLTSCSAPSRVVTGGPVAAPQGYVLLCQREPSAPECSK